MQSNDIGGPDNSKNCKGGFLNALNSSNPQTSLECVSLHKYCYECDEMAFVSCRLHTIDLILESGVVFPQYQATQLNVLRLTCVFLICL